MTYIYKYICHYFVVFIQTYSLFDFVFETGKEPKLPTLKDKIMFWKTYHRYIKSEINRMRQVATNNFKTNFIKGEYGAFQQ